MTTTQKPLSILIAGGGIAGPCLAYWLTRAKLPLTPNITILERAPAPRTQGQSIDIRDAAVTVMRKMGLEEAVKGQTTPEEGILFIGGKGQTLAKFGKSGDPNQQSATSEFEILRADLARIFIDAAKEREGVRFVFGQRISEIQQDDEGVDVTFTGDLPKTRYDMVVAADGAMSKTRQAIFGPDDPAHLNFLSAYFAFFDIPCDDKLDEPPMWRWYNTVGGRQISTRPHRNPATTGAFVGIVKPKGTKDDAIELALTQDVAAQKKVVHDAFLDAGWQADRICKAIETADDFYMAPVTQMRIPKWSKGRCICIGDAGWAPTFLTGAGTSLAMEGAYLLAGELGLAGGDVQKAFENFETGFRPHVEKTQEIPSFIPQAINPSTKGGLAALRGVLSVMGMLRAFAFVQRLFDDKVKPLREFDWKDE